MAQAQPETAEHVAIRHMVEERVNAVRSKNAAALLASYAPDVLTFDLVEPLANRGAGALAARVEQWFGSYEGAIGYDVRDVMLHVAGDVAFGTQFTHVRGKLAGGPEVDMWFRETVGYRKIEGRWKVVHQHSSVPIDKKDGRARVDLQP